MCVRVAWDLYLSFHKEIFLFSFCDFQLSWEGQGRSWRKVIQIFVVMLAQFWQIRMIWERMTRNRKYGTITEVSLTVCREDDNKDNYKDLTLYL